MTATGKVRRFPGRQLARDADGAQGRREAADGRPG